MLLSLGQTLENRRDELELTHSDVAKKMGYSRSLIYRIEQTPLSQPLYRLIQYASILETNLTMQVDCSRRVPPHLHTLIIDYNQNRWPEYQRLFTNHFPGHNLTIKHNIDSAYSSLKLVRLNLIALRHTDVNTVDELTNITKNGINGLINPLLLASNNLEETANLARENKLIFYDLDRGTDSLPLLIEDLLRFG